MDCCYFAPMSRDSVSPVCSISDSCTYFPATLNIYSGNPFALMHSLNYISLFLHIYPGISAHELLHCCT